MNKVSFYSGHEATANTLRGQVYGFVKAALQESFELSDLWGGEEPAAGATTISVLPHIKADILLSFDLADRGLFEELDEHGERAIAGFDHYFVPGMWHKRRILAQPGLGIAAHNISVVGSPRVDHLRELRRNESVNADGRRVLYVPVHEGFRDAEGLRMSSASEMIQVLAELQQHCHLNVQVDEANDYNKKPVTDALLEADVVITDYSSVMYEAWALGKPVIFPRWSLGDRIVEEFPTSAEAEIYRHRIGFHADSPEALTHLVLNGDPDDSGMGVAAFMRDFLGNFEERNVKNRISDTLQRLGDPLTALRERESFLRAQEAEQAGRWDDAVAHISELAVHDPEAAAVVGARLARAQIAAALASHEWAKAERAITDLMRSEFDPHLYDNLADVYHQMGRWRQEAECLERAQEMIRPTAARSAKLGDALSKLGQNERAAIAFQSAIDLAPAVADSDLWYRLGLALEQPDRNGRRDPARAGAAYEMACSLDREFNAARFGLGALHEARENWAEARASYRALVLMSPLDAEAYQRLGQASDRCYDWTGAEENYAKAISLNLENGSWHYRLGFVQERQGKLSEAAQTYLSSTDIAGPHKHECYYRAGYVLCQLSRFEEACEAFALVPVESAKGLSDECRSKFDAVRRGLLDACDIESIREPSVLMQLGAAFEKLGDYDSAVLAVERATLFTSEPNQVYVARQSALSAAANESEVLKNRLSLDCTKVGDWARYSKLLERDGDLPGAIEAIKQVIARSDNHVPADYHRLGALLQAMGRYEEACAAYRDQKILNRPHGAYDKRFDENHDLQVTATFRELYDTLPLVKNTVVYESYSGVSLSCSPYALFKEIISDKTRADWIHVWVIKDESVIPEDLRSYPNVVFCTRDSYRYMRYLATAEFLVNNATFPSYFASRDGQKYLNTWHGTPLKYMGADIKDQPLARANTVRNFLQCSHIIHPNAHTQEVMTSRNLVGRSLVAKQMVSGYPRIDAMLNSSATEKAALRESIGAADDEVVILYAPSYRGLWSDPDLEIEQLVATLNHLKELDAKILFRGHYFAEQAISKMNLPVTVVSSVIDTCALLSIVDGLITDYSSIFFDYLPSRRPVFHLVEDWDQYIGTRGAYLGKDELPGIVCNTVDELVGEVDRFIHDKDEFCPSERYEMAVHEFCPMEDGKSARRVIDFWLNGKTDGIVETPDTGKLSIAMYVGGLEKNGITSSVMSLIKGLSQAGHYLTAITKVGFVNRDESKVGRMKAIGQHAEMILRTGRNATTTEEQWLTDQFNRNHRLETREQYEVMFRGLDFECRRSFGRQQYDLVVDFDGYSPFSTNLMSRMPAKKRAIMLHNAMYAEMIERFPQLQRAFASYSAFDRLVSVSETVGEVNRKTLCDRYVGDVSKFVVANNTIDPGTIIELATRAEHKDPDFAHYVSDRRFKIINLARLSPEKNQKDLILAVAMLRDRGHDVSAYVLGQGPTRRELDRLITDLGLADNCKVFSVKENPFPFLKEADVHVLSSLYEGQGIVLLEAMTLGVPCVAYDVPGPQSVLSGGYGILAKTTPAALADGIERVILGKFEPKKFQPEKYTKEALAAFLSAVDVE